MGSCHRSESKRANSWVTRGEMHATQCNYSTTYNDDISSYHKSLSQSTGPVLGKGRYNEWLDFLLSSRSTAPTQKKKIAIR